MEIDTKPCPICGETIKAVAQKCRFCGEDIGAYLARQQAAVESEIYVGRLPTVYSAWQVLALVIGTLCFIVPGVVIWFVFWLKSHSEKYRVTTQRVILEQGLLSKKKDNIELFRIDDITNERPISMRIMGCGFVRLKSSDRSASVVSLVVKDSDRLTEEIRQAAFKERERRGVKTFAGA